MKFTSFILAILFSSSVLDADTAFPSLKSGDTIVFGKVNAPEYGGNSLVRRATLLGSNGSDKLIVDEVTVDYNSAERKYYACKILRNGQVICNQQISDPLITSLSINSGIRTIHYIATIFAKDKAQQVLHIKQRQCPAAYLIFNRERAISPYRIVIMAGENNSNSFKNLICEKYEFTHDQDSLNDELTVYSHTGLPINWGFETGVRETENEREIFPSYQRIKLQPVFYEEYQKQLEIEVKKHSLDSMSLYIAHMELSWLYQRKSQQNPSSLDKFGEMAKKEIRAADSLQPEFPLKDPGKGPLGLPPFTFDRQVENSLGVNGKYGYKTYRVGKSGKVSVKSDTLKHWDGVVQDMKKNQQTHLINSMAYYTGGAVSPTGFYRVELNNETNLSGSNLSYPTLILTDVRSGELGEIPIPDNGNAEAFGWNPKKDLYYFVVGSGRNAAYDLWQYNPSRKKMKKIGFAAKLVFASPDGRWLIWGNGGGNNFDQSTTGFNAFNTEKGISYRLTHSFEPKYFIGWD